MVRAAFDTAYRASFSRSLAGVPIRIATLRVSAIGRRPPFDFSVFRPDQSASQDKAWRGTRKVYFGNWQDAVIWSRLDLPSGARVDGPAVLEQPDATL